MCIYICLYTEKTYVVYFVYRLALTAIFCVINELFQKAILVKVDITEPEFHLLLHIGQQMFDTGPLLFFYVLVHTAGFCSTGITSSPLCVYHPGGWTAGLQDCNTHQ